MFAWAKTWWLNKTPEQQRTWLTGIFGAMGALGACYGIYMLITTVWKDLHKENVHFSADSSPVYHLWDDAFDNVERKEWEKYRFKTMVHLPNNTSKDLHNVVVKLPKREGLFAVVEGGRKTLETGTFQETVHLKVVPAQTSYAISLWYNEDTGKNEHLIISSDETGVRKLPNVYDSDFVSAWYQWAFWAETAVFIPLVLWFTYKWLTRKFTTKQTVS